MPGKDNPVIIAATSDLFIQSRLYELAKSLGLEARFPHSEEELKDLALSQPRLVILDLASTEYDPASLARTLKTGSPSVEILGFYPHIRKDLEETARNAGVDIIVPNSSLLKSTRQVLKTSRGKC